MMNSGTCRTSLLGQDAPVLALPPELTGHIFAHYVDYKSQRIGAGSCPGNGPLILASVCSTWRAIALSLPELWASVRVHPYKSRDITRLIKLLECWLSRAGTHLIDLYISRSFDASAMARILAILPRHAAQLRSLDIAVETSVAFPIEELQGRLPALESLSVEILRPKNGFTGPISRHPLHAFINATALRAVRLDLASTDMVSRSLTVLLPWRHVRRFEFVSSSPTACVEILHSAPRLETLIVELMSTRSYDDTTLHGSPPLTLAYLRTLSLALPTDTRILPHLVLPALHTLEVQDISDTGAEMLTSLGERSHWALRSVRLPGSHATGAFLHANPALQEVALTWPDSTVSALMQRIGRDSAFLPALRTLRIEHLRPTPLGAPELAYSIRSTWTASRAGSVEVRLSLVYGTEPSVVERIGAQLRPLLKERLRLVVAQ